MDWHRMEMKKEKEKHAAHLKQLCNQINSLKELQKAYEVSIGRKDEVFMFIFIFNWHLVNVLWGNKCQEVIILVLWGHKRKIYLETGKKLMHRNKIYSSCSQSSHFIFAVTLAPWCFKSEFLKIFLKKLLRIFKNE